jgi:hypothetical protein
MPYKVFSVGDEWVTAKENPDGSMGKIFGHHGKDKAKAEAQMRALYASESPQKNILQTNEFRTVTHDGREYMIVPGVPVRAQVMNTYLVPANEIIRSMPGWNGTPITIHHPKLNGGSVKVPAPDVAVIGAFYNGAWDAHGQKMTGEYWIDVNTAQRYEEGKQIIDMIKNGSMLETSTGYWSEDIAGPGEYGGKQYQTVHRNLLPDHIAILPNQIGACSIKDGCGVNRNMEMIQNCAESKPDCDCPFKGMVSNQTELPPFEKGKLPTVCLVGYTFNKGSRTQEELNSLRQYIQDNGVTSPAIIIYEDDNIRILDGNHRIAMADELGIPQIPVKVFNEDYQEIDPEILYNIWKHKWDQGYLLQGQNEDKMQNNITHPWHKGRPGQVGGSSSDSAGGDVIDMAKASSAMAEKATKKALESGNEKDNAAARDAHMKAATDNMNAYMDLRTKDPKTAEIYKSAVQDHESAAGIHDKRAGKHKINNVSQTGGQMDVPEKIKNHPAFSDALYQEMMDKKMSEADMLAHMDKMKAPASQTNQVQDTNPVLKTKKRSPTMQYTLEQLREFLATKGIQVNADGEGFQVEETPAAADPGMTLNEADLTALKSLAALGPKLNAATLDQALQLAQNFEAQQKAEKDSIILAIKANGTNPYTDDDLAGMSLPVLMKLNGQMNMNYALAGAPVTLFGNENVQVLGLPQSLTAIKKDSV